MAAEIIPIDTQDLTTQIYIGQDINLISTFNVTASLSSSSYIEYFTYDLNQNLLTTDYNYTQYTVTNDGQSAGLNNTLSSINIDPEQSLLIDGFDQGSYITYYNFLNKQIGSNIEQLYITEISSDRTEVRLDSTVLSNLDIVEKTNTFIQERNNSIYFLDFYLNFGDNQLLISNNISLDDQDPNNPTILVKLYEPLPDDFDLNSTLWVVTSIEESIAYQVNFEDEPIIIQDTTPIKGPNFNLYLKDQVNNSSLELSYADLIATSLTSSHNQLNSLLEEKEIDINIDYTNFNNFIHFSSAQTRLENFYYKVSLIEQYSSSIAVLNSTNSSSIAVGETSTVLENKISDIITNFDGYDYYLYYSSGSYAWPKTTSEPPYQLATTTSPTVLNWFGSPNETDPYFGGIINSASSFDNKNKDNLLFSIPEFLRDDPDNSQYELFIDMIAQHFDNIWIYYKDVTQKFDADNRLESGISKDIVADAIRDFGIKLYQNNFSNEDLFTAFLGLTPEGGLFPFPNITGSLPTPSGYEYVDTLISASNDYLPLDDVNKSLYKRIYHNLPYLLKSKGTIPGLRALITSYGIPDTILRINEYGGKDKVEKNDWDYWQNEFNYTFYTSASNYVTSSWGLNTDWGSINNVPGAVMFRFKLDTPDPLLGSPNQILFSDPQIKQELSISYTGSGYTSGSYSGSIADPYYQYATLTFTPDTSYPTSTASVYLPFYNEGWWSVLLNASTDIDNPSNITFNLYASNKIYEGGDNGTLLGFIASSSILDSSGLWSSFNDVYFGYTTTGSLQEIRYYTNPISESVFKDYVMNPYSIEGNSLNSGPNELAFRASLGGELYTGLTSIHPKVTGSWIPTSSFVGNSNFSFAYSKPTFIPNTEYFFYDQPVIGIQNAVSDKIRLEDNIMPSGSTLSAYRRIVQNSEVSASYTPATNLLEVAFSPQDEINDDISSQIGYFNIGDFIGDPAFRSSQLTSYPDLDTLRNSYFEKYTKNYNLFDYIRLIKFFDNSLFKMIKDFVPARTSLASGIVIKQHLLERNRYPQPQMSWSDLDISGTLKPQWNNYEPGTVEHFEGGAAGMFNPFNGVETSPYGLDSNSPTNRFGITQSWYETYPTLSGSVTMLHDNQDEFFNGEFSGSIILITTQSLNQAYPVDLHGFNYTPILYSNQLYEQLDYSTFTQDQFSNSLTYPNPGEILILAPKINKISILNPPGQKGNAYIKIHKFDNNGFNNNIPLGQVINLLIKYTNNPIYTSYKILNINEYPDYYLYQISNQNIDIIGTGIDNYIKDYNIYSSTTSSLTLGGPNFQTLTNWSQTTGNINNYFNTSSGLYTSSMSNNIALYISASALFQGSSGGNANFIIRVVNINGVITDLAATSSAISILNPNISLTATYYALPGDELKLQISRNSGTPVFLTGSINITQSTPPSVAELDSVILEPYITTTNYYNSDNNSLINNISNNRKSTIYQDVNYNQGALVPINFDLLIDGDAQKAEIQDSNYTLSRHTNPRYNGSKTTSQFINIWSPSDINTYGKLPNVESNKIHIAYCDTIEEYSPNKMNSSAIVIRYLIDENGTISIPNTSENSLTNTQNTFLTGEKLIISTNSIGSGLNNYRNIIRGGYRIENLLYNQSGSIPGCSFLSTIKLTDKNETGNIISDFQALLSPTTYHDIGGVSAGFVEMKMPTIVSSGSALPPYLTYVGSTPTQRYKITTGMISEGVSITLNAELYITNNNSFQSTAYAQFIKNNTTYIGIPIGVNNNGYINGMAQSNPLNISYTIPHDQLVDGDEYSIMIISGHTMVYYESTSKIQITQSPTPTSPISTVGLWVSGSSTTSFKNILYTTNPTLVTYFNTSNTFQENIPNSGFKPITLPWGLEAGDEFRFEGREDKVWKVNKATLIPEFLLFPSHIAVEMDKPLPISGSVNLDQFSIRRYVEDASVIIFEGLKPGNDAGPYIVSPEFVSLPLRKNKDIFITDLTQKGLLP